MLASLKLRSWIFEGGNTFSPHETKTFLRNWMGEVAKKSTTKKAGKNGTSKKASRSKAKRRVPSKAKRATGTKKSAPKRSAVKKTPRRKALVPASKAVSRPIAESKQKAATEIKKSVGRINQNQSSNRSNGSLRISNGTTRTGTDDRAEGPVRTNGTSQARSIAAQYSSPTTHDPIQFPEDDAKVPKTYLTARQLQEFKQLLLQKRAQLTGDMRQLTSEALNRDSDHSGERSPMPIHLADLGSDNWEQEFTLGLIANERAVVREIDEALDRIADGTYGMCVATHKPISLARLQAKPWAKYSIEYARLRDEGRVP
jgi:DnaK suppressor protein